MKRWIYAGLLVAAVAGGGAARAEITAGTVKIGVLTDMAGPYSAIGGEGSVEAARMAVEDFGGKVAGVPIQVVSGDHQNKTDVGAAIARRWYDQENVDLIVDVPFSSVALAVQSLAREKAKMVIYTAAATERLTQEDCAPTSIQYVYDTYSMAHVTGKALVDLGEKNWYFLTADYVGGIMSNKGIEDVVRQAGGNVVGEIRHPTNISDFSAFLLQAQASKADVLVFSAAGADLINAIKQANEFGLPAGGQKLTAALMFMSDVRGMGLATAQTMLMATSFYWDFDDRTREWSKRFIARFGKAPNDNHAGVYSAVTQYLNAVQALKSDDATQITPWLRSHLQDDMFVRNGKLLPNGRLVKDMYLAQVKTPQESNGQDDLLKVVKIVSPADAFRPLSESSCSLVVVPKQK